MARNLNPQCKQCRREGQKLFLKTDRCNSPKCAMVKRNFPPGAHGAKGYPRLTDYGKQLREKQKAKKVYCVLETQFFNYFEKAKKNKDNTESILIQQLEMRFDNCIFRAGFAKSRTSARQYISHEHFLINGKKVNIASYQLKVGQIISINPKSLNKKIFTNIKEQIKKVEPSNWLSVDSEKLEIKIVDVPNTQETRLEFDPKLVIEFYSR